MASNTRPTQAELYKASALTDSPMGLWLMIEGSGTTMLNSNGSSDPDLHGTYTGADLTGTDTALGAHARFDGTNDHGVIAGASNVFNGGRTRTVEFLIKVNSWGGSFEVVLEHSNNYNLADGFLVYTNSSGELVVNLSERISSNSYYLTKTYDMSSRTDEFFVSITFDRTNLAPAIDVRIDGSAASPDSSTDDLTGKTISAFQALPLYVAARGGSSAYNTIEMSGLAVYDGILSTTRRDAHFTATGLT